MIYFISNTEDLVIFARFLFSRILRGGHIREFKNFAKIIFTIALLKWKFPKSEIRENLNTRKLPDQQYLQEYNALCVIKRSLEWS